MGDRARGINGNFMTGGANNPGIEVNTGGALYNSMEGFAAGGSDVGKRNTSFRLDSSRIVPVGAANVPRSWGSLACAYFGQQARS